MSNQDTTYMHEALKEGDSLYVSKTATQVLQEQKKDKYWEVDYYFQTDPTGKIEDVYWTSCSVGVKAENEYDLLGKLSAFMQHQAGVYDSKIGITFYKSAKVVNSTDTPLKHLTYNQQTKAFTPVVVN